jgi:hypothetical protein
MWPASASALRAQVAANHNPLEQEHAIGRVEDDPAAAR